MFCRARRSYQCYASAATRPRPPPIHTKSAQTSRAQVSHCRRAAPSVFAVFAPGKPVASWIPWHSPAHLSVLARSGPVTARWPHCPDLSTKVPMRPAACSSSLTLHLHWTSSLFKSSKEINFLHKIGILEVWAIRDFFPKKINCNWTKILIRGVFSRLLTSLGIYLAFETCESNLLVRFACEVR